MATPAPPATAPAPVGIFGAPFARALEVPVLVIGRDTWSRLELAAIGITQLRAARIVSGLAREVSARSTRDLYRRLGPASLANHTGAGLHTLYVIWRAFEAHGLDPGAWYWHGRRGAIRTFTTLKAREHRRRAATRRRLSRRARLAERQERSL